MTDYTITYGKASVPVYRHHAAPLEGLPAVPESGVTGRSNALVAALVTVEVFGDNFLPSYTEADNSVVVATDSMKNLVLRETGSWTGATMESLLHHLGVHLLGGYPQMESLRMSGDEIRFDPAGRGGVLFDRVPGDRSVAEVRLGREGAGTVIESVASGRHGMALLKLTGSAFTAFVRDDYTTLPERRDRPLYIALDVDWRYADPRDALGGDPARYVAGEQVRDVCAAVFEDLVSESIQHLVHVMGERLLERYPGLASVSFTARNMTRDPVVEGVYTAPFNAFGTITLTMAR
jgi:urate oxidase